MNVLPYIADRLKKIQDNLQESHTSSYLVSNPANIKYITGLSSKHRELFILLTPQQSHLYYSPLINLPGHLNELYQCHILGHQKSLASYIKEHSNATQILADFNDLTVTEHQTISKNAAKNLAASLGIIEKNRKIKDKFEIAQVTKACQIASKTWQIIKDQIQPGISEKKLQSNIITTLTQSGADQISDEFLPIVASGPNSAIPHHVSSEKIIKANDIVLVDFGCQVNGYWSDMTRTVKLGATDNQFENIQVLVKQAYRIGYQTIENTLNNQQIDQAINQLFEKHGHRDHMPHTTGHNIGLEVHESPSLSRFAKIESIQEGMIFTIEPGIYLKNKFGYRHENTILYQGQRCIELTQAED